MNAGAPITRVQAEIPFRVRRLTLLTVGTNKSGMDSLESDPTDTSAQQEQNMAILQSSPATFDRSQLSKKSRLCIERLLAHKAESLDLTRINYKKQAAVLVLLYEKDGNLRVLLTTRSKTLRAHPGQTALPGGKVDDTDKDVIETAYREANEEVGLPLDSPDIHTLCVLRQFISASRLLVTPVVALLTDLSILNNLIPSEGEVAAIFDHPLEAILDPTLSADEKLVAIQSEHWPSDAEFYNFTDNIVPWLRNSGYRMHRFRSTASPIKGLTAEILIAATVVAYDRPPSYVRWAPGQLTSIYDIFRATNALNIAEMPRVESMVGQTAQETIVGRA
ncbi:NUDIX hydrolase domain-like protein [Irpex rosettiformis]|uniref:NUDIX hydrolase domain-like protein n=1 Tax=Irpex rosettiformis TaxID=378272 RepID=A0ACB8U7D7_9APHY|nr:NUDIX hydrolase domain-like protein [Irpex rosettiformis]